MIDTIDALFQNRQLSKALSLPRYLSVTDGVMLHHQRWVRFELD